MAGGTIVELSRPSKTVWQLTITSPPDNRLTPALLAELAAHLDAIEAEWRGAGGGSVDPRQVAAGKQKMKVVPGAVVITSGCDRFFSNGLDYASAMSGDGFFERTFDPVAYRLLTFPLVTVAAINGHAFAGGMVLALCCDFRIMTGGKGMMCMNEITFASPLPNSFSAIMSLRIPPQHLRDTLLAKRWTQKELLAVGLIDEIGQDAGKPDEVLRRAVACAEREASKAGPGSWGAIKVGLGDWLADRAAAKAQDGVYHQVMDASKSLRPVLFPHMETEAFWARIGKDKAKL